MNKSLTQVNTITVKNRTFTIYQFKDSNAITAGLNRYKLVSNTNDWTNFLGRSTADATDTATILADNLR